MYIEIFARRKFCQFRHLLTFITLIFLFCVKDCIEDVVTSTALAKVFSMTAIQKILSIHIISEVPIQVTV